MPAGAEPGYNGAVECDLERFVAAAGQEDMSLARRDGIDHLGTLCRRIREAHHLSAKEVARTGNLDPGIVSRFELTGRASFISFSRYITGLALRPREQELLDRCFLAQEAAANRALDLADVRFAAMRDESRAVCRPVLAALAAQRYPAIVQDDLWFIHALNRPLLRMFRLTEAALETGWTTWHVIGANYVPGSPQAELHGSSGGIYFPQIVSRFFEETVPWFFTPQMGALRDRLWNLSPAYRRTWSSITAFSAPYDHVDAVRPELAGAHPGRDVSLGIITDQPFEVQVGGRTVRYTLVRWTPRDSDATALLEGLAAEPDAARVYCAADYTEEYNDWPELRPGGAGKGTAKSELMT